MLIVVANKVIGLDNVSAMLLKCGAQLITYSITKFINLPIRTGKFPRIGKCCEVQLYSNQESEQIQQIIVLFQFYPLSARS